jgi:FtsP/CotA-like multicopper oxidase with cupredoxin domain
MERHGEGGARARMPGEVLRIVVRWTPTYQKKSQADQNFYPFDPTDGPGYVWHCHILDHEDNEMMRPYRVTK